MRFSSYISPTTEGFFKLVKCIGKFQIKKKKLVFNIYT